MLVFASVISTTFIVVMCRSLEEIFKLVDSLERLRSKLLDYIVALVLTGSELGRGEHILRCDVRVKWGTHTFIERGEASITTQPIKLSVL